MRCIEGNPGESKNTGKTEAESSSNRDPMATPVKGIPVPPLSTLRVSAADMEALHVRAAGRRNPVLPEFLYQCLPMDAMTLMATIPRGDFAVSIPHGDGVGTGYPILKSSPSAASGLTIIYSRQANGRYEAARVLYEKQAFGVTEFHDAACRWVEAHRGRLTRIPGRYAFFVPDQKLWGVVLRDNGYVALDASKIPCSIVRAVGGHPGKTIHRNPVVRVAVWRGAKQAPEAILSVFTQVEVALESHPGPQSSWISFAEYKNGRILQSRPPESMISDFPEWLRLFTADSGFEYWVFRPGMLFGDPVEWWGNRNRRRTEHEGIDFAEGSLAGAGIQAISVGTPVRALADGEAVAILEDFMNKTIFVRHPAVANAQGEVFYSIYSHIRPTSGLSGAVAKGQVLGFVEKAAAVKTPAHLHLTCAWIPPAIDPKDIKMSHIDPGFAPVVLSNFNAFVRG